MRILVTGGAGFIGSAVCRYLIQKTNAEVVNVDKLTYAGNLYSLKPVDGDPRYRFCQADICDRAIIDRLFAEALPDAELVEVADAGHLLPMEYPGIVTAAIRRLIARVHADRGERSA